jgi:hypothetical protein
VAIGVRAKLLRFNAATWLTFEDKVRREYRTVRRDRYRHGHTLRVIRRRANVDGFLSNELKSFLRIHRKIDRRLVHVQDETPVVITTADNDVHESHEVGGLAFNFGWRSL